MDFTKIATVSGKGGLFQIIKPTRTGVIVESLDDQKKRMPVGATSKISVLGEISIYVLENDGSKPLSEIYYEIYEKREGKAIELDKSSGEEAYWAFMDENVPTYDTEKVYLSDVKKLVAWYNILLQHVPEVLKKPAAEEEEKSPAEETPEKEALAKKKGPKDPAAEAEKADRKEKKEKPGKPKKAGSVEKSVAKPKAPANKLGPKTKTTGAAGKVSASPKKAGRGK